MLLACPACEAKFRLTKAPAPGTKTLKCPKCGGAIPLRAAEASPGPPKSGTFRQAVTAAKPSRAAVRRDDDEDDEDEEPEARRPRKKKKSGQSTGTLIAGGVAVVVIVGMAVAITVWWVNDNDKNNPASPKNNPTVLYTQSGPGGPRGDPRIVGGPNLGPMAMAQPQGMPGTPTAPDGPPVPEPDAWLQDLDAAKAQAAREKKDLLIAFIGSDWDDASARLKRNVLQDPVFRQHIAKVYLPVLLDFPRSPAGLGKVKDAAKNEKVKKQFQLEDLPVMVLADADALPYALLGYRDGRGIDMLAGVDKQLEVRHERDRLRGKINEVPDGLKLKAARETLDYLKKVHLVYFYGPWVDEWTQLARKFDAQNQEGYAEIFFEARWRVRLEELGWAPKSSGKGRRSRDDDEEEGPTELDKQAAETVKQFDEWKREYRFKDPNIAVNLHLLAAYLTQKGGKSHASLKYLAEAYKYKPTDDRLTKQLKRIAPAIARPSSGTGFVVADGYILTNHHVITGDGPTTVRIPQLKRAVPAQVVASDPKMDLALLRVSLPRGVTLRPIPLARRKQVGRGEAVAAFGYPLGDDVGTGLKLTTGVITAAPEEANKNMMLLDAKVNPGNSGGPLCDDCGNVVGVVTAKLSSSDMVDSYGLARPSWDAEAFVRAHLRGFKPAPARTKKAGWADVDKLVSPSVLMVLKPPPVELANMAKPDSKGDSAGP